MSGTAGVYDGSGPFPVVVAGPVAGDVHIVGDRGLVRGLARWCATVGLAHDGLLALDHDTVRLDPATAVRLRDQVRRAGQLLRTFTVSAVGWSGEGSRMGGVLWDGLDGGAAVTVIVADGLSIHARTGPPPVLDVTWDGGSVAVSGWDSSGQPFGPDGPVPVPDAARAALVGLTGGPGRVREVPATSVVAGLLVTLAEVADRCARAGATMAVSAGPPPG